MSSDRRLLRVENLTKRYGQVVALQSASFSIREGEILGLIGPNGSGKTTLFECLGGVLPFDAGSITWSDPGHSLFYLPDLIAPWPDETVGWTQQYMLGLFGGEPSMREEINRRLGLAPLLGVRIGALSKGQRKRALLALGLLTPHSILLADEPFDGLDLRQARETMALLAETAARGRTLFLSIHQIGDAARICDRYLLLSDGIVRGEGTLADLQQRSSGGTGGSLEEVVLALT